MGIIGFQSKRAFDEMKEKYLSLIQKKDEMVKREAEHIAKCECLVQLTIANNALAFFDEWLLEYKRTGKI